MKENNYGYDEPLFKALLDGLPDLIWFKDPEGIYLSCNKEFELFFGATEPEIVGKSDYDFVDKELADLFRENDLLAMESDKPRTNQEWIHYASGGPKVLLQTTKTKITSATGEVLGVLGIGHDITALKQAQENLQTAGERYSAVISGTLDGFWVVGLEGRLLEVNDIYCSKSGYSREELLGMHVSELDAPDAVTDVESRIERVIRDGGDIFESLHHRKDGSLWPVEVSISYAALDGGTFFCFIRDISDRKESEEKLRYIAYYDELTGLPNRSLLQDRVRQELNRQSRKSGFTALVFLDLDGFKEINDNFGHEVGDKALFVVAQRVREVLRQSDTVSRIGGDEFVILLPDLEHRESCLGLIERVMDKLKDNIVLGTHEVRLSASLGVSFYPQITEIDADQLIRQADQAMYQAKIAGKDRYHFFDSDQDRSLRALHKNLGRIEEGLKQQEFELYYQPKVNMRTGQVVGAEALLRWNHPEQGVLAPGLFLPDIEDHPLIIDIGEWTLREALSQLEIWQQQGLSIPVSVNVSAYQLQQENFLERFSNILAEYPQYLPNSLDLEVLETSALENVKLISEIIKACKKLGVTFSLDDFGTGYSSLTYLKMLPTATLKIDQSFVQDVLTNPEELSILDGVIGLADAFRKQVVAEGVESPEHAEILLLLGCTLGQGYGFARPMQAGLLPNWITEWESGRNGMDISELSRENLPALVAMIEHRCWMAEFEQHIDQNSAPPVLDLQGCKLGKWLEGYRQMHGDGELRVLDAYHRQLHDLAETLSAGMQQAGDEHGQRDLQSLREMQHLREISHLLIEELKLFVFR